jgi:hypothetical protein
MLRALLIACSLGVASCAHTTLYRDGRKVAVFQGDMQESEFVIAADGAIYWKARNVEYSTATLAQGKAAADKFAAAGLALAASEVLAIFK